MTELIDWLRVQFDADEADARYNIDMSVDAGWSPVRVLAEVDAKRRILEHCSEMLRPDPAWGGPTDPDSVDPGAWHVVKLLALPYADREGYREEWRP